MIKRCIAECMGTYMIVFAACGAVIANSTSNGAVTLPGIALAPGIMVMVMVTVFGSISSAHFNPAVSIALAVSGKFPWPDVPAYLLAQAIGALLASASHWLLFGSSAAKLANYGAHIPTVGLPAAFGFEVIYAMALMLVIMAVATDPNVPRGVAAPAIGLTVTGLILVGGSISGASMNPFRSMAPALFAGGEALSVLPVYLLAPTVGAVIGAMMYETLRSK